MIDNYDDYDDQYTVCQRVSIFKLNLLGLFCAEKIITDSGRMAEKDKINRIKIVLVEKGVSQKALAEKLSITPTSVFRICKNETQPSLKLLKKIAAILEVDIKDLLYSTLIKK